MFYLNTSIKQLLQKNQLLDIVIVFVLSFVIYQFTLPAFAVRPYPDFWYFGADSYRVSMEETWEHPMVAYQTTKHPLYVLCAAQLYRVGKKVYCQILGVPNGSNLALSFPVAVLGAINAVIAFLAFGLIGFRRWGRALVTTLYAGSASIWVFASFPDSHICTALLSNLFLLAYLKDQEMKRWWFLAFLNALACYCAPQQVLLQVIPWGRFLVSGLNSPRFGRCLRYSLVLSILFLIPYLIVLKWWAAPSFAVNETQRWASLLNFSGSQWWISVTLGLFVLCKVSVLPPQTFESGKLVSFQSEIMVWVQLVAIICYLAMGWKKRNDEWKPATYSLLLYCLAYTLFFIWWLPDTAFLFSAPVMLPFWLLVHSGWVNRQAKPAWLLGLTLACLMVISCSIKLLWQSRDYDIKYERISSLRG